MFRKIAAGLGALAFAVIAWKAGGGAEGASAPPEPLAIDAGLESGAPKPFPPAASGPEGYEATARLVELAKDAKFDSNVTPATQRVLGAHWRKIKPPWFPSPGKLVSSVALRTSQSEKQWEMPGSGGTKWAPDARVWNMNEGSFDQRESLITPAPFTVTFDVAIPRGGKLSFSEGTINATRDAAVFVIKAAGKEVYRHRLPPPDSRRWTDRMVDLAAFAGQTVDLELSVETSPATAEEKKAPRRTEDAGADAGVDLLGVPSAPVAVWGNPTLLGLAQTRVPYNVIWIVVDALRPDVLASFHDDVEDQKKLDAKHPPLEALLPKVPGLTPEMDALAARGVRFTHAYSAAPWTRPGTLAMLSGARSTELGIDTTNWVVPAPDAAKFYASDPPLLPLILRRQGAVTRAFVNNYFMVGYAPVGIEMGFERVDDHRYRTRDTLEVTRDSTQWISENRDQRFFLFVNYNSPHEPYEPPEKMVARVPPPPIGPRDSITRLYMAEAAKDDEAIGVLLDTVAKAGLKERTIIVLTADHGETMSSAHAGTSGLDKMPVRYHHAVSNFEETTRVPIIIVAPGLLPENKEVKAQVRSVDIAPTLLELLGLDRHPRMSGRSLVPLTKGVVEPDERVVISEGRGTRAIISGHKRLLVREGAARTTVVDNKTLFATEELFDLDDDPGERVNLAEKDPALLAEMKARLAAALTNTPVAGTQAAVAQGPEDKPPIVHLRFAGGGRVRRISGKITIQKAKSIEVTPYEVDKAACLVKGTEIELAFTTNETSPVGLDLLVDPPALPIAWDLYFDDQASPDELVFAGPYGLFAPVVKKGLLTDEARLAAQSPFLPQIDSHRDTGLFVVRERRGEVEVRGETEEGAEEMQRLLREWGYAHGSGSTK